MSAARIFRDGVHQLLASALLGGALDEGSGLTTRPSGPVSSAGAHLEWSLGAPDAWACLAQGGLRLLIMRGLGCSSPGSAGLGALGRAQAAAVSLAARLVLAPFCSADRPHR